jgi:hypothetical protein
MKDSLLSTITSLLLILLLSFHVADDIVRGYEKGGLANLTALSILMVWLYGALLLRERRSGYVIKLLGSLLSLAVPYFHMKGKGLAFQVAKSPSGGFFFAWTIIALGAVGLFSIVLSARGLWRPGRTSSVNF